MTTSGTKTREPRAFQPNFIWCSPHLQTIARGVLRRPPKVAWHRYQLATDYGDHLSLDTLPLTEPTKARVLVLHGLTGCSGASPIPDLARALAPLGVETHVLHLRGADRVCPTIPRLYHAGCSEDLEAVYRQLPQDRPWRFIGFSLGANLLLKWLGENQAIKDAKALAVSCPFDLAECAQNLEGSVMARVYRFVMIRRLHALVKPFSVRFPEALTSDTLMACRTFFDFDEKVTAKLHGFEGAKHYWETCSSARFLHKIATPTTLLHSADDPFQRRPPVHIQNPMLEWEIYAHGGHLGFQENWSTDWLLDRLLAHALS